MKKLFCLILIGFIYFEGGVSAQNHPEYGFYFNFPIGTTLSFVTETGSGSIFNRDVTILDEKDNALTFSDVTQIKEGKNMVKISVMLYENGMLMIPFDLNSDLTAAEFKHGKVLYIPYPLSPKIGDVLSSVNEEYVFYDISKKENKTIDLEERKVVSQETIKTPAGEFNCYLLTYKDNEREVKRWVCKNVGFVRTEVYNKKGQLAEKTQLVSIHNL